MRRERQRIDLSFAELFFNQVRVSFDFAETSRFSLSFEDVCPIICLPCSARLGRFSSTRKSVEPFSLRKTPAVSSLEFLFLVDPESSDIIRTLLFITLLLFCAFSPLPIRQTRCFIPISDQFSTRQLSPLPSSHL